MNEIINKFLLEGHKFLLETHLKSLDFPRVLVDQWLKSKKEYKNLKKQEAEGLLSMNGKILILCLLLM